MKKENRFYVYAFLDPRKPGNYKYGEYEFNYEPFYIGKGSGDRVHSHFEPSVLAKKNNSYKDNKIRSIQKINKNIIICIFVNHLIENKSFEIEIEMIKKIGRRCDGGPLTNIYEGGYGSSKSPETRRKISETKKRQYASGEVVHPMLGKKHNKKSKRKMSKSHLGAKWTKEQKENLKKKRCQKKNISQTKYWKVISPDGKKQIVYGLGEFCRNNNLNQPHMFEVAKGYRKHHKRWRCEYYTESND